MILFKKPKFYFFAVSLIILITMLLLSVIPGKSILAKSHSLSGYEQVFPKDDSNNDLSFLEFKLNLLKAIAKKDVAFIYSIITPETKLSFGLQHGPKGLEELWNLKTDPNSKFWPILEQIIKLGCVSKNTPNGKWYYAPYTYALFDGDPYQHLIVTGYNVNLRTKADPQSEVLEQLDFAVVQMVNPMKYDPATHWIQVKTPSGHKGYIASEYLISPIDYRAGFAKVDGAWKMLFFVNGD